MIVAKKFSKENTGNSISKELRKDDCTTAIKDAVLDYKVSVLMSMLKLTTRLLRLSLGEELFSKYINDFFENESPEPLPVIVAEQFAVYILTNNVKVLYLEKILEYELFSVYTAIDKKNRSVSFNFDPTPVLAALENAQLPPEQLMNKIVKVEIVYDTSQLKCALPAFNRLMHN